VGGSSPVDPKKAITIFDFWEAFVWPTRFIGALYDSRCGSERETKI
jgi:hypothetical protein